MTGTILGPGDILVENLVFKELTLIKVVKLWVGVWNCEGKEHGCPQCHLRQVLSVYGIQKPHRDFHRLR